MNLNIRIVLVTIVLSSLVNSQKTIAQIKKREFGMYIEASSIFPYYYGDNFVAKAYQTSPNANLGFTTEFYSGLSFHLDLNVVNAAIEKPELVGNISKTTITRVSFGGGYNKQISKQISIHSSAHLGYVKYGHILADTLSDLDGKTRDDGVFLGIRIIGNYQILEWLEMTSGVQNNFDFLRIETAPENASFFENAFSLVPMMGLRFKVARY